jgi:hypothetical protein
VQPHIVEEEGAAPDGVNQQEEWRFMLLERVAKESLHGAVTAQKAAAWELRCFRQLGRCLALNHF